MVIRRNKPVKAWGWSGKEEKITITLKEAILSLKADITGNWRVIDQKFYWANAFLE